MLVGNRRIWSILMIFSAIGSLFKPAMTAILSLYVHNLIYACTTVYDFPISCQHTNLLVLHSKAAAVADQTLLKNDTDVLESVASRSRIYI